VVGSFTAHKELLEPVARMLVEPFGPVDMVSGWFSFHHTDYYRQEMGAPLFRRFLAFSRLVPQHYLSGVKQITNRLEGVFSQPGGRRVNIDPGILVTQRFVLASGKDSPHRICLGNGIYADLTLVFRHGEYEPLPWTYPDYAERSIRAFLGQVRRNYLHSMALLRTGRQGAGGMGVADGMGGRAP